jgi:hypothetical protein
MVKRVGAGVPGSEFRVSRLAFGVWRLARRDLLLISGRAYAH